MVQVFTKMRLYDKNKEERTLLPKSIWIDPKYDTTKGSNLIKKLKEYQIYLVQ
ncbi:MAG: hypothetical protein KatS3mg068_2380 [Candidatus Sericytochromatia bacterium]|nr:MAG: hypothetical protein KatS3mg068_2380 [Candidatus Sericytochromatia bacterium]